MPPSAADTRQAASGLSRLPPAKSTFACVLCVPGCTFSSPLTDIDLNQALNHEPQTLQDMEVDSEASQPKTDPGDPSSWGKPAAPYGIGDATSHARHSALKSHVWRKYQPASVDS